MKLSLKAYETILEALDRYAQFIEDNNTDYNSKQKAKLQDEIAEAVEEVETIGTD